MRIKKRVDKLECKLEILENRLDRVNGRLASLHESITKLECSHPTDCLCFRENAFNEFVSECMECSKLIATYPDEESMLRDQLRILKERIANLPDDQDEEEDLL